VDKLVGDVAPEGLGALDQDTLTVSLPFVDGLPAFLIKEIEDFYSAHAFRLSELSENVLARNHYEIISSQVPPVPPAAKVWMKHLRVLWKGPWRPAHFWATLNHIADHEQEREGGRAVPLMATVHVYRSLKDDRDNNAIAHVSWLEDDHANTDEIRVLINWPKATHWSRFRFSGRPSLDALPESFVKEEEDDVFLAKVERLWSELDSLYAQVRTSLTAERRIPDDLRQRLERRLNELDEHSSDSLGRPSPQFSVIDRMFEQYSFTLSGVFTWLKGKEDVPEIRRQRWLEQDLDLAESHFRTFQALCRVLRSG